MYNILLSGDRVQVALVDRQSLVALNQMFSCPHATPVGGCSAVALIVQFFSKLLLQK